MFECYDLSLDLGADVTDFDAVKEIIVAGYIERVTNLSPGNMFGASEWIPLEYGGGLGNTTIGGGEPQKSINVSVKFAGKPAPGTEMLEGYWETGTQTSEGTGEYEGYLIKGITITLKLEGGLWVPYMWMNFAEYIY